MKPEQPIEYYHHKEHLQSLFEWFHENGLTVPIGNPDHTVDSSRLYGDVYFMYRPDLWPLHVLRAIPKAQRTDLQQARYLT